MSVNRSQIEDVLGRRGKGRMKKDRESELKKPLRTVSPKNSNKKKGNKSE
jgi:hypothetical protein